MLGSAVDFSDVQGLVRFGYRRLTEASFLLLTIQDAAAAREWLRTAPVTNAMACDTAPETALQIAFTVDGLKQLGVPPAVLAEFSAEFLSGLAGSEARSRLLGDFGASAPHLWRWGAPDSVPHMAVLLYAQPGRLHDWTAAVQGGATWDAAFTLLTCLDTSDLGGVEPFGFVDGVSQPTPDWERERAPAGDQLTYSNVVSLGEFLLGYPNEYGRYTDRPLLAADDPAATALAPAEDDPTRRDLGRNGCYLVLRTLEQDVGGFWRFVDRQSRAAAAVQTAPSAAPTDASQAAAREALAQAMVGRHRNGDPLVPLSTDAIPGVDSVGAPQNQFTFDTDPNATGCPFGAHIRRANPRNADLPTPAVHGIPRLLHTVGLGHRDLHSDSKASTRFHRILRRGREYGARISAEQAIANGADSGPHGIHFLALVANIARQFEFLQSAWLMSTKFDALSGESDPLLGNREPVPGCPAADTFSRPREDGVRDRISGMPQFVAVKGGAYFFLPSLSALRYLAALGGDAVAAAASTTRDATPAPAAVPPTPAAPADAAPRGSQ